MRNKENVVLKAIDLWKIIIVCAVLSLCFWALITGISNILSTKMIILLGSLLGVFYILIQHKISKNIAIKIIGNKGSFQIGQDENIIRSLKIHSCLIKGLPAKIIRLNNSIFVVIPIYDSPFAQVSDNTKEKFMKDIEVIKSYSEKSNTNKWTAIDYIPLLFNISFYMVIGLGLAAFIFLIIIIFQK